jgi:urease accessory protein
MNRPILALATVFSLLAVPASAHTGIGAVSGVAAGLAHPLLGLDHLLAMVAVGLLAARLGGRALWSVPACFVGAMIVASIAGMAHPALPLVELGIAASVVILGAAIALGRRLPVGLAMALAGTFALFHGHAHGAEVPAAAGVLAYGAGFVVATIALHAVGIGLGLLARRAGNRLGPMLVRVGGGSIAAAGLALATI